MRIRFMSGKVFFGLLLFGSLLFIGFGDQFLPKPYGRYSRDARNKLEQVLIGAFPQDPMAKTKSKKMGNLDKQADQIEKQVDASK